MGVTIAEVKVDDALVSESTELAQSIIERNIRSQVDYEAGSALGADITRMEKRIKATFEPMKQKAQAAHREIVDQERTFLAPLGRAKTLLRQKLNQWATAQRKRQVKTQETRARKAAETHQPFVAPVEDKTKTAASTVRRTWSYRITDPAQIPREYLKVDEVKLRKLAVTEHDRVEVPGVEFYAEESVAFGR